MRMRNLWVLALYACALLVACERQEDASEEQTYQIPVLEITPDSYESAHDFLEAAFGQAGAPGALWLSVPDGDEHVKIMAINRIFGCIEAPMFPLTIFPCMGGYCMDESWYSVRDSKLDHDSRSMTEMKQAVRKVIQSAEEASEAPALCIFYDSDTPWEPVYEILLTIKDEGARSVTFEALPSDEHQMSEGLQRKRELMNKGRPIADHKPLNAQEFEDFHELMERVESLINGDSTRIEVRNGAEAIMVNIGKFSEIDPMVISLKRKSVLMGAEMTPIDMKALGESLVFYSQGCDAAGYDARVLLFASEGTDMNSGISVLREMSKNDVHLWFPPDEAEIKKPQGVKPVGPGVAR